MQPAPATTRNLQPHLHQPQHLLQQFVAKIQIGTFCGSTAHSTACLVHASACDCASASAFTIALWEFMAQPGSLPSGITSVDASCAQCACKAHYWLKDIDQAGPGHCQCRCLCRCRCQCRPRQLANKANSVPGKHSGRQPLQSTVGKPLQGKNGLLYETSCEKTDLKFDSELNYNK